MNNNRPPASIFQKSERETGNQVSLALCVTKFHGHIAKIRILYDLFLQAWPKLMNLTSFKIIVSSLHMVIASHSGH